MKWLALLMMNAVPVICLTLLAVHFETWWIVLFAPLLSFTYETNKKGDGKDENG